MVKPPHNTTETAIIITRSMLSMFGANMRALCTWVLYDFNAITAA